MSKEREGRGWCDDSGCGVRTMYYTHLPFGKPVLASIAVLLSAAEVDDALIALAVTLAQLELERVSLAGLKTVIALIATW